MNIIYYVEINLICIVILLLLRNQLQRKSDKYSAEMIVLKQIIMVTIILCASDMVAGIFRGKIFWSSRTIIEMSNLIFFEALSIISYLWMIYVNIKLKVINDISIRKRILWSVPLILITIVCVSNPWTNILFSIDENNLYSREIGIIFHWIVTWLYLIIPTIQTIWVLSHVKNKQRRQEIKPLLYFIGAPFICSIVQMFVYGVTSSQVGITLSILIIFLSIQRRQIMRDSLTGLNNRHGLENYLQNNFIYNLDSNIFVLMLDLNGFKQINDKLGHVIGDCALKDAAHALKLACKDMDGRIFLCRFGGDEFVIIMNDCSKREVEQMIERIQNELQKQNINSKHSYKLGASIGVADGRCSELKDIEHLLLLADEAMYNDKKHAKRSFNKA